MDKSYATPELAKMAIDSVPDGIIPIPTLEQIQRWLREEKKVNVYCAPIFADPEWLWMACIDDEAVTDSEPFIRNDREVLKVPACVHTQLFKDYYDALTHGIASQFGIWRYQKR